MKQKDPIQRGESYEAISRQAAERMVAALEEKPGLLLCAAGGSTPARAYELLVESNQRNPAAFASLRVVKLDEWGGIAMDDPGSCETQLQKQLINPLGVASDRYYSLDSNSESPELACQKMRNQLAAKGPIDLCILGLGVNGHVGMNEPAATLDPFTHVATLAEVSLRHPMLKNSRTLPAFGLTLGMVEILSSREIILLVNGKAKREALRTLLQREITTEFPASFLWLHSNWTLLCEPDAAEGLNLQPSR
jgi:galactosamine-6-phosphate isomerase